MTAIVRMKYVGSALPGNAERVVLFSTVAACPMGNWGPMMGIHSYHYDIKNDQPITVEGFKSSDRGVTWTQFYSQAHGAAAAGATNSDVVLVEGYADFKFESLNGATPQTTFIVDQDCSTFP